MNDQNEITEILNDGVAKKMELRRSFYEWLDKNPDSNVWQWILNKLNEQQQVKVEPEVIKKGQGMTYKKRLEILIQDARSELEKAIKLQDESLIKTSKAYLNGLEKAYEVLPTLSK